MQGYGKRFVFALEMLYIYIWISTDFIHQKWWANIRIWRARVLRSFVDGSKRMIFFRSSFVLCALLKWYSRKAHFSREIMCIDVNLLFCFCSLFFSLRKENKCCAYVRLVIHVKYDANLVKYEKQIHTKWTIFCTIRCLNWCYV